MANLRTTGFRLSGTGLFDGGILTINADTTKFDLASGSGQIVDNYTDSDNPSLKIVSWGNYTAQTDTYLTSSLDTQIAIDSNGNIAQFNSILTPEQFRDYIFIGKTVHSNLTNINAVVVTPNIKYGISVQLDDLIRSIGVINISGNSISANGANLSINKSSGLTYRASANYANSRKSPNIIASGAMTPVTFKYRYRNGTGGFVTTADTTTLVPGSYDDGDGTLGSVNGTSWSIQRVYFFTIGTVYVTYGQQTYSTLVSAVESVTSENPIIDPQFSDASLRAYIVMRGNSTDLTDTVITKIIMGTKFNP